MPNNSRGAGSPPLTLPGQSRVLLVEAGVLGQLTQFQLPTTAVRKSVIGPIPRRLRIDPGCAQSRLGVKLRTSYVVPIESYYSPSLFASFRSDPQFSIEWPGASPHPSSMSSVGVAVRRFINHGSSSCITAVSTRSHAIHSLHK